MELMLTRTEDGKELSSSDRKCHVVEVRRSLGQDYLPIRYGNWSKVICEFRHRYCQVEQGHYHDSSSVTSPCTHIDEEETHPKISSEEEHISTVIKKLDDYFQTKGMPVQTSSPAADKGFTLKGQDGEPLTADSGIHSAATGSPLDLSQNFLDFDLGKDPSETLQGKFGVTKVYIERYQCEDCGAIFANMEEASGHFENHLSRSKGNLHDDEHNSVSGGDTLEVYKKGESSVGKMQDSEGSENCEEGNCEANKQGEDDEMTSTTHDGNKDYSEEKPLLEDHEATERNGLDMVVINAKWQEAEKSALDSSETKKKRKRKGKKRKKNKPWRLIKRAFMLTIIILF